MKEQGYITVKGMDKLTAKIREISKVVSDAKTVEVLTQNTLLMAGYCKTECPVDSGRLRASIGGTGKEGIFSVNPKYGMFGTAVHYAFPVEFGTNPYVIKPKNAKVLAWPAGPVAQKVSFTSTSTKRGALQYQSAKSGKLTTSAKKGQYIFAKSVKHPGIRARHFMQNGITKSIPHVMKNLESFYTKELASV